ncbi:MAG: Type 1 glutamine amidotransferase-like domain-containing protein [Candidatus Eiseniibacteriota bacterium]
MRKQRHIVAIGGGSFYTDPGNSLDDFLIALTKAPRPRVCLLPTAGGDADLPCEAFLRSFLERRCRPSVVRLFRRDLEDLESVLLAQDLIFVGGGNTANLMAVWRVHGVDRILRAAHERGIVLAGVSAGGLCWFDEGLSDSYHVTNLKPVTGLLGLLKGSFCPHYDSEENRRPIYRRLVAEGGLASGMAADDGVALHFADGALVEAVAFRPGGSAWQVERVVGGGEAPSVTESPIATRLLGEVGALP